MPVDRVAKLDGPATQQRDSVAAHQVGGAHRGRHRLGLEGLHRRDHGRSVRRAHEEARAPPVVQRAEQLGRDAVRAPRGVGREPMGQRPATLRQLPGQDRKRQPQRSRHLRAARRH